MATKTEKRTLTTEEEKKEIKMMKYDYKVNELGRAANNPHRVQVQLPNDIIYDILKRVPVQSLIKLRRVCKQWSTLILDPAFVDLRSRTSGYNSPGFIFHSTNDQGITHLFFFDLNKMQTKEIPFRLGNDVFLNKNIDILCSLDGLLLISSVDAITGMLNYHVCNPITSRCTNLPHFDVLPKGSRNLIFGLAYDSVMAKYKAVCCGNYYMLKNEYFCKIVTVDVQGDSWRDVKVPKPHRLADYPPVFASGNLHWTIGRSLHHNLDRSIGMDPKSERLILSMDVSREVFYTIECPPTERHSHACYSLVETRGLLCFIDHVAEAKLKLWVLKEEDHWTNLCSINVESSIFDSWGFLGCFIPFGIVTDPKSEKSKLIILSYDYSKDMMKMFYSYDMELKQLDDRIITWSPWQFKFRRGWISSGSSALWLKRMENLIPIFPKLLPSHRHSSGHPTSEGMFFSPHWHVNSIANF